MAIGLLAFAFHTVTETSGAPAVRPSASKRFFEHTRTITAYLVFPDAQAPIIILIKSKPPPEIASQIPE